MLSKTILNSSALLIVLSLAACVTPPSAQSTEQSSPAIAAAVPAVSAQSSAESNPIVTRQFRGSGLDWSTTGGLMYRYVAIERDGEVYVCGAFTGRGHSSIRKLNREAMRQATVTVNGQSISRNMRYFTEASNSNWDTALVGVATNCRTTGQSADAVQLDAVRVEMRGGRYRVQL